MNDVMAPEADDASRRAEMPSSEVNGDERWAG